MSPLALDILRLGAGAALLYFGAEWLIAGAAGLARAYRVRPLVIGLTVVAYGTSAPELAVSVASTLSGQGAIALGNVVGSNIANLGLILGLTALISPPRVPAGLLRREVPALVVATGVLPLVLLDGRIDRLEALALLAGAIGFSLWSLRAPPKTVLETEAEVEARAEELGAAPKARGKAGLAGLAVVGLAVLVGGGRVFVDGAVGLARAAGMSERVVGLTVVAIGTSLPELAASVVAALRGHSSIAIGNVVGSNVFNVLLILGVSASVRPFGGELAGMTLDLSALSAMTLFAAFALRTDRTITRLEGALLTAGYAAFLAALALG